MNFLQICQHAREESGIAGTSTPSTVVAQTGILGKLVTRTAQAWVDIQTSRQYWDFARSTLTFPTVAAQRTYDVVADLSHTDVDKWDTDSVFIYTTSVADQAPLEWKDYQWFIRHVDQTYPDGRPTWITELPGKILAFDRTPDDVYTITADYWRTPELLADDTDTPGLPEQLHWIIVWKSVMMYAGSQGAGDMFAYAKGNYDALHFQLVMDQGDMPKQVDNFPIALGNRTLGTPLWPRK